uniref:39S ribosomal protein L55, mitochondrial n=1 Tax=Anopheles culicifacies TaxID=139723 RepID=A0A182LXD1_9DIPT
MNQMAVSTLAANIIRMSFGAELPDLTLPCPSMVHRSIYARRYPTVMVLPNGATINLSYHEPRRIIKLPLDLSQLSETERKARIEKRKPKQKIRIDDDVEDTFNANKYLKYMKKK